jgi:iron complex outermembrane receptor protein
MPDGQGQVPHFDIAGAKRIEVLRGPFSAFYGANSGCQPPWPRCG